MKKTASLLICVLTLKYEKVAFIVKNKGVKCEKKLGKQAKKP